MEIEQLIWQFTSDIYVVQSSDLKETVKYSFNLSLECVIKLIDKIDIEELQNLRLLINQKKLNDEDDVLFVIQSILGILSENITEKPPNENNGNVIEICPNNSKQEGYWKYDGKNLYTWQGGYQEEYRGS